ncbi:mucin-17-like, partial [Littorina saxatilis]|uniref:mucin-17-like n=1 Tax=Littorina saxatilis TaxID=31220 RepID=UPI0038B638D2
PLSTTSTPLSTTTTPLSTTTTPLSASTTPLSATTTPLSTTTTPLFTTTTPLSTSTTPLFTTTTPLSTTTTPVSTTTTPLSTSTTPLSTTTTTTESTTTTPPSTTTRPKSRTTTTESTTTTPKTATTTYLKSTTPATFIERPIAEITVTLDFSIKFSAPFHESLLDKTSTNFSILAARYTTQLTQAFSSTIGFQFITVDRFWPGSTGVDYAANYNYSAVTNRTELHRQHSTNVSENLNDLPDVDSQYLNATFNGDSERAAFTLKLTADNLCAAKPCKAHPFYNCSVDQGIVLCISPCFGYACGAYGATCFLDSVGSPKCRCPADDQYVYGGERCDQRAEKLDLSSDTVIAIASGLGGGLVLVVIVVLAVTCFRRHRRREGRKLQAQDSESFRSITGMNRVAGSVDGIEHGPSPGFYRNQPGDIASFLQKESGSPTDAAELARFRSEFYRSDSAQRPRGEDFVHTAGGLSPASSLPLSPHERSPPLLRHGDVWGDNETSQFREARGTEASALGHHKSPDEIYLTMTQEEITIQRPQVSTHPASAF